MIRVEQGIDKFTYDNIKSSVVVWDKNKPYNIAELARVESRQYKSIIDSNFNNPPLATLGEAWFDYAVANDYAMLDFLPDTKTQWDAEGIVEFERGVKDTIGIGNFQASLITIEYLDALSGVVDGLTIGISGDLTSIITEGLIYVDTKRFDFEETSKTFTASKDTYIDIDVDGLPVYTEVVNGDPEPPLTSLYQRIAKVVTDIDNVTSTTDLRTIIDPVLDTVEFPFSTFNNMYNPYLYGYGGFTDSVSETLYSNIKRIGTYVRVTFSRDGNSTDCGFMVVGVAKDMGDTLNEVIFPDRRVGSKSISVANFATRLPKNKIMRIMTEGKTTIGVPQMFVIDPSANSSHSNMVIQGEITKVDGKGEYQEDNFINWEIKQNIED